MRSELARAVLLLQLVQAEGIAEFGVYDYASAEAWIRKWVREQFSVHFERFG